MGIMVYSLLWAMQDLYHQPYRSLLRGPLLCLYYRDTGAQNPVLVI